MPLSLQITWEEVKEEEEEEDTEEGATEREVRKKVIVWSKEAVKMYKMRKQKR